MQWRWMDPDEMSRRHWALRLAAALVGLVLVLVGIVLWIMPVLTGWPLILAGLPLLFGIHPRGAVFYHRRRRAVVARAKRAWEAWRTRRK